LDNVSPGVTVIDVSISESVELGLVENANGVGFVEEVVVGLFLVVIDVFVGLVVVVVVVFVDLVGLVAVVLLGLVVVFAVVRVVDVDVIVVFPNFLRFEPFLIILFSSSLVEVGCGARLLPAVFSFSSSSEDFLVFSAQIPYVAPLQVCLTVYLVPFGHTGMVWVAHEGHEGAPATSLLAMKSATESTTNGWTIIFDHQT